MERPERIVLFMIGAFTDRMAAVLWVILTLAVITVANRISVRPAYHDQFEARFRERAGLVRRRIAAARAAGAVVVGIVVVGIVLAELVAAYAGDRQTLSRSIAFHGLGDEIAAQGVFLIDSQAQLAGTASLNATAGGHKLERA